jgi:hypothetical protein
MGRSADALTIRGDGRASLLHNGFGSCTWPPRASGRSVKVSRASALILQHSRMLLVLRLSPAWNVRSFLPRGARCGVWEQQCCTHASPSPISSRLRRFKTCGRHSLPSAVSLGLPDVDVSALCGPERVLTQEIARYLYEQGDPAGRPRFNGLRCLSHYNTDWECWAIFTDRLVHRVVRVDPIPATTPGLFDAARILKLRIEEDGGGRYVVPYEE